MAENFVSLNKVFLPSVGGGHIEGNLEINGKLIVNDKSGNGTYLDVADKINDNDIVVDSLLTQVDSLLTSPFEYITPTINTDYVPSENSAFSIKYYPQLRLCFFRGYIAPRSEMVYAQGTQYTLATVPEEYRPNSRWALNEYDISTIVSVAQIKSDGSIILVPKTGNIPKTYAIYISGCWVQNG